MALSDKLPKHITEASVESSVKQSILRLKLHGGLSKLVDLLSEAEDMLKEPAPHQRGRLDQMLGTISKVISPITPCKKGCSACCYMAVAITTSEAKRISEAHNIPMEAALPMYDQARLVQKYVACKCPFLEHGSCQIYEHRPDACRGFFNITEYPELCDVINYPGSDVPSVDLTAFWYASSVVAAISGETAADIREFFPEGLHPTQSL